MKTAYYLSEAQRMPVKLDGNLQECRAQLRAIAREELARARARYGKAYLHRDSADVYLITLGPERRSAMWTSLAII